MSTDRSQTSVLGGAPDRELFARRLVGRVAVVTGGGHGIGAGIASRLAAEGAAVAVLDVDADSAAEVAAAIGDRGAKSLAVHADVVKPDELEIALEGIQKSFDTAPDIVVCNAGEQTFTDIWNLTMDEWDRVFDVNVRGAFSTLRTFAKPLKERGRGGAMVTVTSLQARLGAPYYAHYAASKAALLSLTKSFAVSLANDGVRVNSVAPGAIRTRLWDRADEEMSRLRGVEPGTPRRERIAAVPLGRAGEPDDVAGAVAFLASDDSSYITGECLHVCGGDLML